MNLRIFPPDGILEASVDLPLSKSISARALLINAIGGFNEDIPLSDADDTKIMHKALPTTNGTVHIDGAGTAMRFLTAYFASVEGTDITLDGNERMRNRPIGALVDALKKLGADIEYAGKEGFPPLHIKGRKLSGGEILLDTTISSQFVSALMMVTPMMANPLSLKFDGEPASLSYIKMTAAMMEQSGVECEFNYNRIDIPNIPYSAPSRHLERDWSAASFWYSVVALSAGWVTLNDMALSGIQGDAAMKALGEKFGVITSESEDVDGAIELSASPEQYSRFDADMTETPDLVPPIVVAALALGMPFRISGVHTLRNKESDRLEALRQETLKLGLIIDIEGDDVISWEGKRVPMREIPRINPHDDHRIAMAFAPLAIFLPGITIENVEVVSKSYPNFWTHFEQAGFILQDADKPAEESENDISSED